MAKSEIIQSALVRKIRTALCFIIPKERISFNVTKRRYKTKMSLVDFRQNVFERNEA